MSVCFIDLDPTVQYTSQQLRFQDLLHWNQAAMSVKTMPSCCYRISSPILRFQKMKEADQTYSDTRSSDTEFHFVNNS